MRLVADENFPRPSVLALRDAGFDVLFIQEEYLGSEDPDVLRFAIQERRILLTFDRDFGELIYHHGYPSPPGIILLRFKPFFPLEPAELLKILLTEMTVIGKFTVIRRNNIRQRELPKHNQ